MKKNQNGFSSVMLLVVAGVIGVIGAVGWYVWQNDDKPQQSTTSNTSKTSEKNVQTTVNFDFKNPKKSAHYESNTPDHATVLAAVPVDVVINFNFDLHEISTIKIMKDGKDYGTGDTKLDSNLLTMRRKMSLSAPDGLYTVQYNACWPDRSCHDGHFQFAINSKLLTTYTDKRNQEAITIKMSDIMFRPMNIRISPNTKVTWVNDDAETHYVNTDSHPHHTQVLGFNSKALDKGDSYSYTFTKVGAYPYHCSAHEATMKANIVVE